MARTEQSEGRSNNAETLETGKRQKHVIINEVLLYPRQKQSFLDDLETLRETHMSHDWEKRRLEFIREVKIFVHQKRKMSIFDRWFKKKLNN